MPTQPANHVASQAHAARLRSTHALSMPGRVLARPSRHRLLRYITVIIVVGVRLTPGRSQLRALYSAKPTETQAADAPPAGCCWPTPPLGWPILKTLTRSAAHLRNQKSRFGHGNFHPEVAVRMRGRKSRSGYLVETDSLTERCGLCSGTGRCNGFVNGNIQFVLGNKQRKRMS